MTTHTISGSLTLPDDTSPLIGEWRISLATLEGTARDVDGSVRAGTRRVATDPATGAASITLPDSGPDDAYAITFKSKTGERVELGPYQVQLAANMTWSQVINQPVLAPIPEQLPAYLDQVALSAAYGTAAPAAVGVRTRPFDKRANVYGSDAARATLRRALGACLGARANLVNLLIVGDSWESGWKATQIGSTAAVPGDDWGTVLKNLMKEAGYPVTGGWVPAGNGNTPGDARWTFTGTWVRNFTESTFAFSNTAGSTATFTSDDLGTVLEVAAFSTAASVQRSIDGGGAAAWNLTANQVNVQVNPGLGNAPHSVTLTVPVGQQLWVCAARVRQTTGLSISNCAIFGSHTDDWLPTYKNTAGGGGSDISWLNPYKVTRTLVGGTAPTLAIVALGANDAIHAGHTPASMKTNLAAIVNAYKTAGAAVLQRWYNDPTTAGGRALLTPVQAGGVTWETFRSNSYDVSDTYDTVLIDHATVLGDPDTLEAAGLVFSDHLHLLPPGQAAIARADLRALASV